MGRVHESISAELGGWIARQHLFFVGTAPLAAHGHLNLSPKGMDTLRVIDERTVAYLDLTGSGVETISHLRENGRITLMWCALEGPPRIVRIHGLGEVASPDDERVRGRLPRHRGARAAIVVSARRISESCGYGVPRFELVGQRSTLTEWTDRRSDEELVRYRAAHNAASIDGLPGLAADAGGTA